MKLVVTGGRNYGCVPFRMKRNTPEWKAALEKARIERRHVHDTLSRIHSERKIDVLIHGRGTGADDCADEWAREHGIMPKVYPAIWYPHGQHRPLDKSAGPRRNQQMIDEEHPDMGVHFPGGRGTADMVIRMKAAGLEIVDASGGPDDQKHD